MENIINGNLALAERTEGINEELDNMQAGFTVLYKQVSKNNCIKEALVMQAPEFNVVPTVYPDTEMMQHNNKEIAKMLIKTFLIHAKNMDMSQITQESYIRKNIFPRLVNGKNIESFKKDGIAYLPYLDLAICFAIRVPEFNNGTEKASVKLTNELLKSSGLTLFQAREAAMENMKNEGYIVKDLIDMISDMTGIIEDDLKPDERTVPMYILTNPDKFYGAASILSPDTLRELEGRIGSHTFVLLPSSVHEFLVTRMGSQEELEMYKSMVSEVNSKTVSVEDYLSDSIYICSYGKITVM